MQVFYECGDQGDTVSYKSCCEGTMDPRGQELPGNRYPVLRKFGSSSTVQLTVNKQA
jgi:hypothetical protein